MVEDQVNLYVSHSVSEDKSQYEYHLDFIKHQSLAFDKKKIVLKYDCMFDWYSLFTTR